MKLQRFNPSATPTLRKAQPDPQRKPASAARSALACLLVAAAVLLSSATAPAKSHKHNTDNTPGNFDYYLLTLSWAPEFCATHGGSGSASECGPSHHFGFVVHGLWPENQDGSYPQHCGSASPVSQDIVRQMMPIMPASYLIQHEWSTHGTCSGLDSQTYFGDIKNAFSQLQIPADYRTPAQAVNTSPGQIEQKFATANNAPASAFHVSCSGSEFVALEVCLTKDLKYRQCGSGVTECRIPQITLLPPK
jgi:ribonuclease T2